MKKSILIVFCALLFMTSCGPKIVGTWNIDRYEVKDQKGQDFTAKNIGEITLQKNKTGEKNINYTVFRNEIIDAQSFKWKLDDNYLTIMGTDPQDNSQFNKTWIITTNKRKKQLWKSTDGSDIVQILELSKK